MPPSIVLHVADSSSGLPTHNLYSFNNKCPSLLKAVLNVPSILYHGIELVQFTYFKTFFKKVLTYKIIRFILCVTVKY